MPTLLIPPIPTFEAFLSKPGGSALAIKKATGTSLDIETLKKVLVGTARPASADALLQDMVATFPTASAGAMEFDEYVQRTYPRDEDRNERNIVLNRLSWQIVIQAMVNAAPTSHAYGAAWVEKYTQRLLTLDKASVRATALANTGRFMEAVEIIRATDLAQFLPPECWKPIEDAGTVQDFAYATAPLRMLGALFILAVAEIYAYPDTDISRFANCLPIEDGGNKSFPFARCIAALQTILKIRTAEEFADKLLLDNDKADTDHQRRNLRRWRQGTVPEQAVFGAMLSRAKRLMGAGAWEPKEELPLYLGLRYLHALGRLPSKQFFGSKKAFFGIYPALYALAKEAGA